MIGFEVCECDLMFNLEVILWLNYSSFLYFWKCGDLAAKAAYLGDLFVERLKPRCKCLRRHGNILELSTSRCEELGCPVLSIAQRMNHFPQSRYS